MSENDGSIRQKGVYLNIQSTVKTDETKAAITGTQLPDGSTFGLFICEHHDSSEPNPYIAHSPQYNNIKATLSNGKWMYSYAGYTAFPTIFVLEKLDENDNPVNADVFAYAPYHLEVTTPESVPFDITEQNDYMYALENNDPSANKNINPAASGTEVTVPLTFAHAFALLEFKVLIKNDTYNHPTTGGGAQWHDISGIKVRKNSSIDPEDIQLYRKGTMNAMTGAISIPDEYGDVSELSFKPHTAKSHTSDGKRLITATFLMVPAEPDDDEYIFDFFFDGIDISSEFTLKKEHLKHGTSDEYGFKAGYKYTFNFELDNYMHFCDVQFGEWTTIEKPIYEIEI